MKKTQILPLAQGDVLLLTGERLARIENVKDSMIMLQYIDRVGMSYEFDGETIQVERNLGQSNEVLTSFYTARSILGKISR